ncbi:MAG: hydrolase TatD [Candidatus Moraniibacteriota bacterium]|nr:MAG: hydrolase TatD [Candidatus Moranbacteria bacterium]
MIDSHAHIHDTKFDDDREDVVKRAKENGVSHIITIGTNYHTSQEAIALAQEYDMIYATVGLHPLHLFETTDCAKEEEYVEEFDYDTYVTLAKSKCVVAIGEVGLDYHHFSDEDDIEAIKAKQVEILKQFIHVCNEVDKPIVIHCWDGYAEILEILTEFPVNQKGVIHSYIGSWKNAQKFIALGYKIGLNGIVTYGESYEKLIRNINLGDVLIETDAPYLPPRPLPRENRCEPRDVWFVADKIAQIKEIAVEQVIESTAENTKKLFGI